MTAWGWAGSAPAPSTADLESAPRLPPMAAAVARAAEGEVLALAPVGPASAEEEVVVARKIAVRLREREGGLGDLEGAHAVADIHDARARADGKDDAFHGAHVVVGKTEIGGESNQRSGHC